MRTFDAWTQLIEAATESIQLAGMYWSLRGQDVYEHPSDWQGEKVFKMLKDGSLIYFFKSWAFEVFKAGLPFLKSSIKFQL